MRAALVDQFLENHSFDNINENLSKNLSLLLKKYNVSEGTLARELSLPYNTIHRLVSGYTTDPRISTLKLIASYFNVSMDSLLQSDCILSDANKHVESKKNTIDETLLHHILKKSHPLYPVSQDSNNNYADFVLGLLKEVQSIDTSKENLLKIIELAISSISSYEDALHKHNYAM